MPRNPLEERVEQEKLTSGLVGGRDIDDELTRIKKNVEIASRRFSARAEGLISKTGSTGRSSVFSRSQENEAKLNAILARKRMGLQKQKMEAIFNNAFDLAVRYGMDEASAEDYARKLTEQENEQEFNATESEKQRAHARKLDVIAGEYSSSRLALEDEFAPSRDYGSQVLGSVLGVGSEIVLDRLLRRKRQKTRTQPRIRGSKMEDYQGLSGENPYKGLPDYFPSGDFDKYRTRA